MSETLFFGERWDAPAFDDAIERKRPVGETCGLCEEPIEEVDSGTWQVFVTGPWEDPQAEVRPLHIECWIRQGLGSPAHLRGECSCHGTPEPPEHRSWREQGREVIRMLQAREGIFRHG